MATLTEHDKAVLTAVFNPTLPIEGIVDEVHKITAPKDEEEYSPEIMETISMQIEAIQLAEKGELMSALEILNKAIQLTPKRPSLYNDRAHVYQYLRQFDDALEDLTKAVSLCSEKHERTLCQAHCQRGILYRRSNKLELAKDDFERAASLGSKFAKSQLIELNPYAALCNQMLRQVMEKLN